MVLTMKLSFLVIGCIPLLGGWGCYDLVIAVGPEEEDEGLFHKGIKTEGEKIQGLLLPHIMSSTRMKH